MTVLSLTTLVRNASNKLPVVSCTMHGPSIQQYSWHYLTLPLNKPLLVRTPRSKSANSLTTCGLVLMQRLLPCLQYDSQCPFQCLISLCISRRQSGRWLFLPWQLTRQWQPNQTQWRHPHYLHHPQACCCIRALFLNTQEAKVLHLTLDKLGHPQPPTPPHQQHHYSWHCQ
jgi:hypothetical protein